MLLLELLRKGALDLRVWALLLALQLPALRTLSKYLPEGIYPLIPAYLVGMFVIYTCVVHSREFQRVAASRLDGPWPTIALLGAVALANFLVYPIADSLKYQMRGSDQDDALIQAGLRLLAGQNPYEAKTYAGHAISPGPGWVILALPFTTSGLYFLLTPSFLAAAVLLIRALTGSYYRANLFALLLLSSLAFWEVMAAGSDMPAAGILFLYSAALVYHAPARAALPLIGISLLVSLAATTRVIFAYLIPLLALLEWRRRSRRAAAFLLLSGALLLLLHLGFYSWNPQLYAPLHILDKGGGLLGSGPLAAFAVLLGLLALYLLVTGQTRLESWLLLLWFCLFAPMLLTSMADLAARSYDLAEWEGANYLTIPMPVYLAYLCLTLHRGASALPKRIAMAGAAP